MGPSAADKIQKAFLKEKINIGHPTPKTLSWTFDETTMEKDLVLIEKMLQNHYSRENFKNKEAKQPPLKTDSQTQKEGDLNLKELQEKIPEKYQRHIFFSKPPGI